jgi:hypothetical protein
MSRRRWASVVALSLIASACSSSTTGGPTTTGAPPTAAPTTTALSTPTVPPTTIAASTSVLPTTSAAPTTLATTAPPTSAATTTTGGTSTTLAASGQAHGLHGGRYCEVLLVRPTADGPRAEVYNSYPLNDCPAATWATLDAATIARVAGVPLAVLNGPRYWLMDEVTAPSTPPPPPVSFGGIDMILRATVDIGSIGGGTSPYTVHRVDRRTVFDYASGRSVYELVAADGQTYVMQSWSQQVDPTLEEPGLAGLGDRLKLPTGWTYRVRTLTEVLRVDTTGAPASVVQDELGDSYSLEGTAA